MPEATSAFPALLLNRRRRSRVLFGRGIDLPRSWAEVGKRAAAFKRGVEEQEGTRERTDEEAMAARDVSPTGERRQGLSGRAGRHRPVRSRVTETPCHQGSWR